MFSSFGTQLEQYRDLVMDAAKSKNGDPIYNASLEHAAILVENLFKVAERDVNIFSGSLNPRVFGGSKVLDRAAQFLGRSGSKVRIIVENEADIDIEDHPFLKRFKDTDDLELVRLDKDLSEKTAYHFIVADSDSYRFEKNKSKPAAVASFGDAPGGERLSTIFEKLWQKSKVIPLGECPQTTC